MTCFQIHTRNLEQVERAHYSRRNQAPKNFAEDGGKGFATLGIVDRVEEAMYEKGLYLIQGRVVDEPQSRPKESYITLEECDQMYDRMYRARREEYIHVTDNLNDVERAKLLFFEGKPGFVGEGVRYGFVTEIVPIGDIDGRQEWRIRIRPTHYHHTGQDAQDLVHAFNRKESIMKVYEGLVLTVDDKGEVTGVAKIVTPFTAKNVEEAKNIVRIDYAAENKLSGKDAAALQVRVREFPLS